MKQALVWYTGLAVGAEVGASLVWKDPVSESDPGYLDHPHFRQEAAPPLEHAL